MEISLRIWKWSIFGFDFMSPDRAEEGDFNYFSIWFLAFYFSIERYLERTSLIVQIGWENRETIFDYEKILKEIPDKDKE